MTPERPRIRPCGETALSVDFGNVISQGINTRVHALDRALRAAGLDGVIETVPTYRSLAIHYDPLALSFERLEAEILRLETDDRAASPVEPRRWRVPVVFGEAHGQDLGACARDAGLSPEAYVERIVAARFRVMMIGYMPGFSYLAGLPELLARPRRSTPRPNAPAGSFSIGGGQAAIGSVACPSGWHLLGRTPVRPFHPGRQPIFLFEPGDEIRLEPLAAVEWDGLAARAEAGDPLIVPESDGASG